MISFGALIKVERKRQELIRSIARQERADWSSAQPPALTYRGNYMFTYLHPVLAQMGASYGSAMEDSEPHSLGAVVLVVAVIVGWYLIDKAMKS